MAVYFRERKHRGDLSHILDDGLARIDVKIFERWIDKDCSTTARCGDGGSCEVEKTVGLNEKSAYNLKSIIEASIGAQGLASVKSQVEAVIGSEVNWSISERTKKTFQFQAPKCGRYSNTIYQLERDYEFTYFRKKVAIFGSSRWVKKWTRTIVEDTNKHDCLPDIEEFDEYCKCPKKNAFDADGLLLFDRENISFRVPYRFTKEGLDVQIFNLLVSFSFENLQHGLAGLDYGLQIDVPAEHISSVVRFLGAIEEADTVWRVSRYIDAEENLIEVTQQDVEWSGVVTKYFGTNPFADY